VAPSTWLQVLLPAPTTNYTSSSLWCLGVDGIYDLDLRKNGQNALTYVSVFRFRYAN